MWHMHNGNFWGMHFLWWIFWIIVIIGIFVTPWGIRSQNTKKDTPLDILKKRFAKGEISKEEFEEKKKVLEHD